MKKENALLLFFILLKFSIGFIFFNPVFELHRDEYLYYQQGQHLDFGYLENPPMIGLLAAMSSFFGGNVFWIKFWPALFGALTLFITLKMVKEFGGGLYAQAVAALGILFSAYLRIHFLFQPNFLDIFFWSLGAYFLIRYINSKNTKHIFYLAIALALGWYSKYSVLFFVAALMLAVVLTQHRKLLVRKEFWFAASLAVLIVLPNIVWQYFHNWPLFHHMKELRETQLQHLNRVDFIKEQILMLLPVSFVWVGGTVLLLQKKQYRIIGYCFLWIVILIMMGSGKGYYTLGAYPMLLAAGGVWTEQISRQRTWLRYSFVGIILLLALPFFPVLLPMQKPNDMAASNKKFGIEKLGLLKWEDGENHLLQQDFADMLGWKEITEKAESLFQHQPDSLKRSTLIYGANYGLAGAMKYYAKTERFRNSIISENGTFVLWIPGRVYFKDLIFIDDELPEEDDSVLKHFSSMTVIDSCTNIYSRQYNTKIIHFQNASDSASIIFRKDIQQAKTKFIR